MLVGRAPLPSGPVGDSGHAGGAVGTHRGALSPGQTNVRQPGAPTWFDSHRTRFGAYELGNLPRAIGGPFASLQHRFHHYSAGVTRKNPPASDGAGTRHRTPENGPRPGSPTLIPNGGSGLHLMGACHPGPAHPHHVVIEKPTSGAAERSSTRGILPSVTLQGDCWLRPHPILRRSLVQITEVQSFPGVLQPIMVGIQKSALPAREGRSQHLAAPSTSASSVTRSSQVPADGSKKCCVLQ